MEPLVAYVLKLAGMPLSIHRSLDDAVEAGYSLDEPIYEDDDGEHCVFCVEELVEGADLLNDHPSYTYDYRIGDESVRKRLPLGRR
jgi:hypothetical protein